MGLLARTDTHKKRIVMKTNSINNDVLSHIKIQVESFGKIKRTYPRPNYTFGYYESLSLIK